MVVIDETTYNGGDINLKLKAITDFGEALYEDIVIIEKCLADTITVQNTNLVYNFEAVSLKNMRITSDAKPEYNFVNSDTAVCPTTWSFVNDDLSPLDSAYTDLFSVNNDGYIEMNQMLYSPSNDSSGEISVKIKAITPFGSAYYGQIKVTRKIECSQQTLTIVNTSQFYQIDAVKKNLNKV